MARTAWRPTARGELSDGQALSFSMLLGTAGSALLYVAVNPLTMWLTLATFVGYAIVYTVILKPLTPQNIVIGGASGAMPPVLGWAAMRNDVGPEAMLLCLIIFLWTPPHFWALALYRTEDYRRAGLPMLPVTHGSQFTRLHVLLYTLVLFAATLLPFVYGMSGWLYLAAPLRCSALASSACVALVAPLQRRAGAADVSFFHLAPVAAVRGAAAGSLSATMDRVTTMQIRRRVWVCAAGCARAWRAAATSPAGRRQGIVSLDRHHRCRVRSQTRTARCRGQAAQPRRVQGQGRGGLLRLHAVSRRVPHHDGRAVAGQARVGRRRRAPAGHLRHRRPRA